MCVSVLLDEVDSQLHGCLLSMSDHHHHHPQPAAAAAGVNAVTGVTHHLSNFAVVTGTAAAAGYMTRDNDSSSSLAQTGQRPSSMVL